LVYLPANSGNATIKLEGEKTYSVKWFNPRTGGEMQTGSIELISGAGFQKIGGPPSDFENDWVVVIESKK
jgi:hypothetical protein